MDPKNLTKVLSNDEAVVASVPKEAFKAMFYLFAGKPDSKVKVFNRRVIIKFKDLKDLNYRAPRGTVLNSLILFRGWCKSKPCDWQGEPMWGLFTMA